MKLVVVIIYCLSLISFLNSSTSEDAIKPNQSFPDSGKILVSNGKKFELGFFSPTNSNNRYVGIWFKNIAELTTVWVANRDNPITDSSGVLKITETGNIVIVSNKTETLIWSSNSSAKDPTLQLLNTGNLVVKDGNSGSYAWQSFDHPCDSFIEGMKLGWDFTTGQTWHLTSWKSLQDPSIGIYTYEHDHGGLPQVLLRKGQDILYRNGPWDGVGSGSDASVRDQSFFIPRFVINETQRYYTFENGDNSTITRFWLNPLGSAGQLRWNYASSSWVTIFATQKDDCDTFARCGPKGVCDSSYYSFCRCPDGFVQKDPEAWAAMNSSAGCVLKTRLNCSASEGFKKFSRLKLPHGSNFTVNGSVVGKEECEVICRKSCSCVAYAVARIGGCVVWAGDMLDMKLLRDGGQDLYIRMAASELG